ncbi:iron-sulfur cluster assembly scaffold protein [Novosphingobium subterraneum]|uniref:iron-sulfur cluster assembly scaffold protein n=1 Tax=Novosphingobium subterraneum TaxID=48936 RepID=UPI003CFBF2D7
MTTRGLYTPDILGQAMVLAQYPWVPDAPYHGAARSRSCGSSIELSLRTDDTGAIEAVGVRPHACAVGQAAAAVFAEQAAGRSRTDIARARVTLAAWLAGEGNQPEWPGIHLLNPALAYPARHASILLAWDAALDALPEHVLP